MPDAVDTEDEGVELSTKPGQTKTTENRMARTVFFIGSPLLLWWVVVERTGVDWLAPRCPSDGHLAPRSFYACPKPFSSEILDGTRLGRHGLSFMLVVRNPFRARLLLDSSRNQQWGGGRTCNYG